MIDCFYADFSLFQIIVAIVAFLGMTVALMNGGYTIYKIFERPKLRIYLTDSIGIVISPREVSQKFHLGCNVINQTSKVGVLHHLESTVIDPNGKKHLFLLEPVL